MPQFHYDVPATPVLLLTAREAAKALAVSERTLFNLTKAGRLPAVRIGTSVRYRPADLQSFIDAQLEGGDL